MSFLTLGLTASAAAAHRHEFSASPAVVSANTTATGQGNAAPGAGNGIAPYSISALGAAVYKKDVRLIHSPYLMETEAGKRDVGSEVGREDGLVEGKRNVSGGSMVSLREGGNAVMVESEDDSRPQTPTHDSGLRCSTGPAIKPPRQKTAYQLAHPPPSRDPARRLVHGRGGLILQLQRLSDKSRPVPMFDIMPSSSSTCPSRSGSGRKLFKMHDLMMVASEDYNIGEEDGESEDSGFNNGSGKARQPVACMTPPVVPKGKTRVEVSGTVQIINGSAWEVSQMSNGGYEFVTRNEETGMSRTARWVPRIPTSARRNTSQSYEASLKSPGSPPPLTSPRSNTTDKKFVFSVLNPETRKHPILANLTKQRLEVLEHNVSALAIDGIFSRPTSPTTSTAPYKFLPNTSSPTISSAATSSNDPTSTTAGGAAGAAGARSALQLTLLELRHLILATGSFVALQETLKDSSPLSPTSPTSAVETPGAVLAATDSATTRSRRSSSPSSIALNLSLNGSLGRSGSLKPSGLVRGLSQLGHHRDNQHEQSNTNNGGYSGTATIQPPTRSNTLTSCVSGAGGSMNSRRWTGDFSAALRGKLEEVRSSSPAPNHHQHQQQRPDSTPAPPALLAPTILTTPASADTSNLPTTTTNSTAVSRAGSSLGYRDVGEEERRVEKRRKRKSLPLGLILGKMGREEEEVSEEGRKEKKRGWRGIFGRK